MKRDDDDRLRIAVHRFTPCTPPCFARLSFWIGAGPSGGENNVGGGELAMCSPPKSFFRFVRAKIFACGRQRGGLDDGELALLHTLISVSESDLFSRIWWLKRPSIFGAVLAQDGGDPGKPATGVAHRHQHYVKPSACAILAQTLDVEHMVSPGV